MSHKCFLRVNIKRGYKIQKINVVTAFLYRLFNKIVYIEQSHLFELNLDLDCCLQKALYGLKQVPQVWYKTLANFVKKQGLEHLKLDHSVFVSQN